MLYRLFLIVLMKFCFTGIAFTQEVYGVVMDENGAPIPYVSIYVEGSTTGTTSNLEGFYNLKLAPGNYNIIYQFIGYKSERFEMVLTNESIERNVDLVPQSVMLNEVVIVADGEDPAYAIIRNAIEKRQYYRDLVNSYSCDVYVKGNQKILKAPEKIMGFDIGDLDGMLDSNRQGIVYLSETISSLYVSDNQYKEVVTSSKLSGNDRGYSFNSAKEMEFNFYDNAIELQRQMISPIARNALSYYRYKLEGFFIDAYGNLINQIAVIPKRESDPTFYGKIFIVNGTWNIHSLELGATAASTQLYFVDSLTFRQIYVPVEEPDKWALFSNKIDFKIALFGFESKGIFTGVYRNYNLQPDFEKGFFDANVHIVEKESNERDSLYWSLIRPVPLTEEEEIDYKLKDSIYEVRHDPVFMDSVDRENSAFKIGNVISGYRYSRRSKRYYFDISSPLGGFNYNTVQGYNLRLSMDARKYFDEGETRRILMGTEANYGFAEKRLRINGYITYRPSRLNLHEIRLSGGSKIEQFNSEEPISPFLNSLYSLFRKENKAKYLGIQFAKLTYRSEVSNGVLLNTSLNWENRSALINNSDISYGGGETRLFTSNNPIDPSAQVPFFENHQAFYVDVRGTFFFKQKYFVYPDRKFFAGNEGPILRMNYIGAFKLASTDIGYHKIALSLEDEWKLGVAGRLQWYVNGGVFFGQSNMEFRDYRHFMGNEIFFMKNADYSNKFLALPYYSFSTNDQYFQVHLQQFWDGFFLDKVPLFQKMGWSLVTGAKYLKTADNPNYWEFHLGINNIGYKIVRLARLDTVLSIQDGRTDWALRLSLGIN